MSALTLIHGIIIEFVDDEEIAVIRTSDGDTFERWMGNDIHAVDEGHDGMFEIGDEVEFYLGSE